MVGAAPAGLRNRLRHSDLGIAYGGQYVTTRVRSFARHTHRLQQAFGVVVIVIAVGLYYQYDTFVTVWLSNFYPDANVGL